MFGSVLVANRGEIAVRVIAALNRLGIRSIAVYSDADANAPHVRFADLALRLGPARPAESYLSIERVLAAARDSGAEAIHPGYGFLSENPAFSRACREAGVVFVGPSPETMELLGDKVRAKLAAEEAGVPVVPGLQRPGLTDEEIIDFGRDDGALPVMIKAAAGGGGRGMRIVHAEAELREALSAARREAMAGFGDDTVFVERYVKMARHIEVQLLADTRGNVVHLGERECSLQRRHQKVVEEAPSPVVSGQLRERLGQAAVAIGRRASYHGAGTVEFLVSAEDPNEFFFLEVNTRLQVEHPVTEAITGIDLVEKQLQIAAGAPLGLAQQDIELSGHAIEVRVTAEDPGSSFLPAAGEIVTYRPPVGPGVRVDSGVELGSEVTTVYDSLLAKVITSGRDREEALERIAAALHDLRILGVTTNTGFLYRLINSPRVSVGDLDTGLIERGDVDLLAPRAEVREAAIAAAAVETLALHTDAASGDPWDALVGFRVEGPAPLEWDLERAGTDERILVTMGGACEDGYVRLGEDTFACQIAGGGEQVRVTVDGQTRLWDHAVVGDQRWVAAGPNAFAFRPLEPVVEGADAAREGALEAPMPGTILAVRVDAGAQVAEGDTLVVMESMKMELSLAAPADGIVANVHVAPGEGVRQGQPLVELEAAA